jgi:hypothetical protein
MLGTQLGFAFPNLPLRAIHPRAQPAAQATEAVAPQGLFCSMHDLLFKHHDDLEDRALLQYPAVAAADAELVKVATDSAPVLMDYIRTVSDGWTVLSRIFVNPEAGRRRGAHWGAEGVPA